MSQRVNKRWLCVVVGLVVICSAPAWGEEAAKKVKKVKPPVELLWPNGAPLAKGDTEDDKPTLSIYLPPKDRATGTAIVICPGGGYQMLASGHEGRAVARWLNSIGVAGFVLKYRHRITGYRHPAPLLDAQRAMRMVRSRAKEWKIDPARIGIMGFSAGGHLASSAGTHFDEGDPQATDPIDRVSCRPDFMVLVYPVISFVEPYAHIGSRDNLLGKNPDMELAKSLSSEKQVTEQTPPAFLVHTSQDKVVPVENSLFFYLALQQAHVPAELHVFTRGEHGFGLSVKEEPTAEWTNLCEKWMKKIGLIKSEKPKEQADEK